MDNAYYHKTEHYRVIYQAQENNIHIINIDTRTNMKMKKYGINN
mgnify:CR=1 FL=1